MGIWLDKVRPDINLSAIKAVCILEYQETKIPVLIHKYPDIDSALLTQWSKSLAEAYFTLMTRVCEKLVQAKANVVESLEIDRKAAKVWNDLVAFHYYQLVATRSFAFESFGIDDEKHYLSADETELLNVDPDRAEKLLGSAIIRLMDVSVAKDKYYKYISGEKEGLNDLRFEPLTR
jgi:hypothetical protein